MLLRHMDWYILSHRARGKCLVFAVSAALPIHYARVRKGLLVRGTPMVGEKAAGPLGSTLQPECKRKPTSRQGFLYEEAASARACSAATLADQGKLPIRKPYS
jgi:hypothetical protein